MDRTAIPTRPLKPRPNSSIFARKASGALPLALALTSGPVDLTIGLSVDDEIKVKGTAAFTGIGFAAILTAGFATGLAAAFTGALLPLAPFLAVDFVAAAVGAFFVLAVALTGFFLAVALAFLVGALLVGLVIFELLFVVVLLGAAATIAKAGVRVAANNNKDRIFRISLPLNPTFRQKKTRISNVRHWGKDEQSGYCDY